MAVTYTASLPAIGRVDSVRRAHRLTYLQRRGRRPPPRGHQPRHHVPVAVVLATAVLDPSPTENPRPPSHKFCELANPPRQWARRVREGCTSNSRLPNNGEVRPTGGGYRCAGQPRGPLPPGA